MGLYNTNLQNSVTIGGLTFTSQVQNTGDGTVAKGRACTAAKGGVTLTVRTSNTAGTITVPTGFVTTGDRLDLYNPADSTVVVGLTAGTVVPGSPNDTVPLTTGNGANLPLLSTTNLIVAKPVSEPFNSVGTDVLSIGATATGNAPGVATFTQADNTYISNHPLIATANYTYTWAAGGGVTNPVTGVTVGKVWFSTFATDAGTTYPTYASALVQ